MKFVVSFISLCFVWVATAQLPSPDESEIPKLAPPLPELPPTFWELHGTAMLTGGIAGAIIAAVVVWWMLRAKPVAVLPPEVQARRALEALSRRAEDGALLSQVSQILHRYFRVAFELPAGELTTAELCQALAKRQTVGLELSRAVADFLRRCDDRKFSPSSVEPLGAVSRAIELIALAEARRAQIREAAAQAAARTGARI